MPEREESLEAALRLVMRLERAGACPPALVRLEQQGWIKGAWGKTESNREAKFYSITRTGEKELARETERWRRLSGLVDRLLMEES